MKDIQAQAEQIKADKRKLYDFERFNIDYLSSTAKLFKTAGGVLGGAETLAN
jgi:hypothetical protein